MTGGSRGIGDSIAQRMAKEGATVYALDYVIAENSPELTENFKKEGLDIRYFQCDVTNDESIKTAFEHVVKESSRIDILVNNAGITRDNLLIRMSEQEWDSVMNTNLKGAFLCAKNVARTMMGQRAGRIINISSIVGIIGNPGQANYCSSKAGMIGLTKSLAKELGSRNVLVNAIAPGFVITPMTDKLNEEQKNAFLKSIPLQRSATPEDIANGVMFFASDDSSYITGQVLRVDGGLSM